MHTAFSPLLASLTVAVGAHVKSDNLRSHNWTSSVM
jgi:hypothetical protein